MFQVKLLDCFTVSLPINIEPSIKVVKPVPPFETDKVPKETFETFTVPVYIPDIEPETLIFPITSKVVVGTVVPIPNLLLLLSQCKLEGWIIWLVPLPTNILLIEILFNPVPPLLTDRIPEEILDAFKNVNPEPLPEIVPVTFKSPVFVTVNLLLNVPPLLFLKFKILLEISNRHAPPTKLSNNIFVDVIKLLPLIVPDDNILPDISNTSLGFV